MWQCNYSLGAQRSQFISAKSLLPVAIPADFGEDSWMLKFKQFHVKVMEMLQSWDLKSKSDFIWFIILWRTCSPLWLSFGFFFSTSGCFAADSCWAHPWSLQPAGNPWYPRSNYLMFKTERAKKKKEKNKQFFQLFQPPFIEPETLCSRPEIYFVCDGRPRQFLSFSEVRGQNKCFYLPHPSRTINVEACWSCEILRNSNVSSLSTALDYGPKTQPSSRSIFEQLCGWNFWTRWVCLRMNDRLSHLHHVSPSLPRKMLGSLQGFICFMFHLGHITAQVLRVAASPQWVFCRRASSPRRRGNQRAWPDTTKWLQTDSKLQVVYIAKWLFEIESDQNRKRISSFLFEIPGLRVGLNMLAYCKIDAWSLLLVAAWDIWIPLGLKLWQILADLASTSSRISCRLKSCRSWSAKYLKKWSRCNDELSKPNYPNRLWLYKNRVSSLCWVCRCFCVSPSTGW